MRCIDNLYRSCRFHGSIFALIRRKRKKTCAAECRNNDSSATYIRRITGPGNYIKIRTDNLLKTKERLNRILSENTGKTYDEICLDTERDNFMTADEAQAYGLVDKVISKR